MSPLPGGYIAPPLLEPLRNSNIFQLPSGAVTITGFVPTFDNIAGSFTTSPIRFLDSVSSYSSPAGDNRRFGITWQVTTGGARGSITYGDNFIPAYNNAQLVNQPQWHEDAPNAVTGGVDGTLNFEIAVLQVLETPADLPAQWFSNLQPPVIGQYFNMGTSPTMVLSTLAADPVGFERTYEMIFSIRRVSDLVLMAEANVRFTAIRT